MSVPIYEISLLIGSDSILYLNTQTPSTRHKESKYICLKGQIWSVRLLAESRTYLVLGIPKAQLYVAVQEDDFYTDREQWHQQRLCFLFFPLCSESLALGSQTGTVTAHEIQVTEFEGKSLTESCWAVSCAKKRKDSSFSLLHRICNFWYSNISLTHF